MEEIAYVSDKAHEVARWMEKKLQEASANAGILFASVKAMPVKGGQVTTFEVRIGIIRELEEQTGYILIKHLFEREIQAGLAINAAVYRGVRGAAGDSGNEAPHQDPS